MKNIFFIIIVIFSGIVSCKINEEIYDLYNGCTEENLQYKTTSITIGYKNSTYQLETYLATNNEEYKTGLMCRENLPAKIDGMVFTYEELQSRGFWMHKTYMPITIIYFDKNRNSISISSMNPCTRNLFETKNNYELRCLKESYKYKPDGEYLYVLEIKNDYEFMNEINAYSEDEEEKLKLIINN